MGEVCRLMVILEREELTRGGGRSLGRSKIRGKRGGVLL
jgi:hypothetical protein